MILTDSHCHLHMLDLTEFDNNLNSIIEASKHNNVLKLLCVGTTLEDLPEILSIAHQYQDVNASLGLHPNENPPVLPSVEQLIELAKKSPKIVAIGETGLDYFRSEGDLEWQRERFRNHIRAARQVMKPIIIHSREARQDTLKILKEENAREVGGVFHCFTEDWETASEAIDLGFYVSFSGIVTFKNAVSLQEVAKKLPLQHMLIETDSPFLAPNPFRGKMNQPAFVKYVAESIALLKDIELEEVARETTQNYQRLFKV